MEIVNPVKDKLAAGELVLMMSLRQLRTPDAAMMLRECGYDGFYVDNEHGMYSKAETAAGVRVVIECKRDRADGTRELFGTIGVNTNIIDASWQALVDAYEYHLIQTEEAHT